jgi:hypothetical protein
MDFAPSKESTRCDQQQDAAQEPSTTSALPPSSTAGFNRPSNEATVIAPIAVPSRIGRKSSAFDPMRKTGSAPSPVANAVALAERTSRTTSMLGGGESA